VKYLAQDLDVAGVRDVARVFRRERERKRRGGVGGRKTT